MYAFWKYDLFPYCLGGKTVEPEECGSTDVENLRQRGYVQARDYATVGRDNKYRAGWVRPFLVLDDERGECLKLRLEKMRSEYTDDIGEVKRVHRAKLANLMAAYGARRIVK